MVERKRINLVYRVTDNWIGGTYYILNIIRAVKLLDDVHRPHLNILHIKDGPISLIQEIDYPYITFEEVDFSVNTIKVFFNKIFYRINGRKIFKIKLPSHIRENVYPLPLDVVDTGLTQSYYWIPDFQEHYYPEFFSSREVRSKHAWTHDLSVKKSSIVFSSENALNDYNKFYPLNKSVKKVLKFASFIEDTYKTLDLNLLKEKFGIRKPYFIAPNQFWKHKNQQVILNAILESKKNGVDLTVVFTGKMFDARNPEYSNELLKFVETNGIGDNVFFLGFIDRNEQLKLISGSIAVIQPSLFEGWSTVVEDSKVLNHYIVVSDIPLHREQIDTNAIFFDPKSSSDLLQKISKLLEVSPNVQPSDYTRYQIQFGKDFIGLF